MSKIFDKLKEKSELQPKFIATQNVEFYFPIYTFDLNSEIDPDVIASFCKKYQTDKYKEQKTESVYAWRSEYHYVKNRDMPEFEILFEKTLDKVQKIWKRPWSITVADYWFAIYNKGDNSMPHDHGDSDMAVVYYASVPKNSAPLHVASKNGVIKITPEPGMLVVMPGRCIHSVPKSQHENGERIIVAMNIIRDRFLGTLE